MAVNVSHSSTINEPYSSNSLSASASATISDAGGVNVTANTSNVSWSISATLGEASGYTWGGASRGDLGTVRLWINGNIVASFGIGLSTGAGNGTSLGSRSGTTTITHNSDGKKSVSCYIQFVQGSSDMHVSTGQGGSANLTLTTIPRASNLSITGGTNLNAGSAYTINTNRASSSFTHTITYTLGSASGTIGSSVGASVSWTPPVSLLSQFTTSVSKSGTLTCTTYTGSTKLGTSTLTFNLYATTSNSKPTVSATITETNSKITAKSLGDNTMRYISVKSIKVTPTFVGGATLKSIKVYTGSTSATATTVDNAFTLQNITDGNGAYYADITDSRGLTHTGISLGTKTWVDYIYPTISMTVARTSQVSETGTVKVSGMCWNNSSNTRTVTLSNAISGTVTTTISGNNWSGSTSFSGQSTSASHTFVATIADAFNSASVTVVLSPGRPSLYFGNGVFGGYGNLFVGGTTAVAQEKGSWTSDNTYQWIRMCDITIIRDYANFPITLNISSRGRGYNDEVNILFASGNTKDPAQSGFYINNRTHRDYYRLVKEGTSKWYLAVRRNEQWGVLQINQVFTRQGVTTLDFPTQAQVSLPTSDVYAPTWQHLDDIYPVGSIYQSTVSTSPATLFGGTWEQIQARMLIGAGSGKSAHGDAISYTNGSTGGNAWQTLSATIGEVDSDPKSIGYIAGIATTYNKNNKSGYKVTGSSSSTISSSTTINHNTAVVDVNDTGRNTSIMPPYLVVYMWKRTA